MNGKFTGRKFFNEKEEDFYEYELDIPKSLHDSLVEIAKDKGITFHQLVTEIMDKWAKGEL